MKISIVIPVYNEAAYLDACLESIATQTVKPYEVIVVNNNSTDNSAIVAAKYDFVTLIYEPKQGVIHARTTGFNAARGEIIGRIDADTVLPADWTANVSQIFLAPAIDAVSGSALYYDIAGSRLANQIDLSIRRILRRQLKKRLYLWGANMAMRREAWQKVRPSLCNQGHIHEDYDIAIHLQEQGRIVLFDEQLKAYVSSRRINTNYADFVAYAQTCVRTYVKHSAPGSIYLRIVVSAAIIGYLPIFILHRGYDSMTGKFSWYNLLSNKQNLIPRVDPTSNVA